MLSPLRPLGFDFPQQEQVNVDAPQQLPQPDNTGLQVVSQTAGQFQQTLQAEAQSQQAQARAVAEVADSQVRSAQAISQATVQVEQMKATRAQQGAQSFNNLGDTILQLTDQYAKTKANADAAQRKAFQEAQYAAVTKELEDTRIEWIQQGRIDKEGTAAYRDTIASRISKYQLGGDEVRQLTERYYAPALSYAQQTEENRQRQAEDVIKQQRAINVAGFQGQLSLASAKVAATAGLEPIHFESAYLNWKANAEALLKDEQVPLIDRLEGYARAQETLLKVTSDRNMKTEQLANDVASTRALLKYAAEQAAKFRNSEISSSDYQANVKIRATELGLPGFGIPDPLQDQDDTKRLLQGSLDIEEIQRKRVESDLGDITAKDTVIGALVTQFQLSPTSYEAIKNSGDYKTNANAKAAIEIFDRWRQFRDSDTPQYNAKQQRYASEMRNLDADFQVWFVNATRDSRTAGRPPGVNQVLEAMRSNGDPAAIAALTNAQQGKSLTQQDVDIVRNAYIKRLEAVREEARTNEGDFKNRQREFERYGLYFDVKRTRAAYDKWKKDLDADQAERERIRKSSTQAPDQPGNSPDFNGGSPGKPLNWKPLVQGNYGGRKITFPFGQGATIYPKGAGQGFTDSRPGGRQHSALDFAVPVGTPTTSLVYGRIRKVQGNVKGYGVNVEVVGDDGFIYHYAHLNKVLAVEGQRVGPGEVIALTGNTDGGANISTGPHLHLGVYAGDYSKPVDPLQHLATRQFGDRNATRPRVPRSSGSNLPTGEAPVIPKGAIPLGGNQYLYNGRILKANYSTTSLPGVRGIFPRQTPSTDRTQIPGDANGSNDPVTTNNPAPNQNVIPTAADKGKARYTRAQPIRNSYAGAKKPKASEFGKYGNNHGYSILAKDPEFAASMAGVAEKHGVEAEWLADMIAVETANTFSPRIGNGLGYFGLIQFGEEARRDLGVTTDQLRNLSRRQQLTLVDRYLTLQKRYAGVDKFRNVEELAAAIHLGHTELRAVREGKAPSAALNTYINSLGKYTGRQYDHRGNRRRRVSSAIHEHPNQNCATCYAMLNQTGTLANFFPHEAQTVG